MNRKIIFSSIVMAFIFSGCLSFEPKPIIDKKEVKKVEKSVKKREKVIKDTKDEVKNKVKEISKPEESKLQDVVVEEVDISDDSSKPKLIESVD